VDIHHTKVNKSVYFLKQAALIIRAQKNIFMGVFGDHIRDIRVQKGLSQQQVAEHIGTSLTQVWRWEAGQTAPSIENAALLARFYNVSLDRLCGLQDRPDLDLEGLDEAQIEALQAVVGLLKGEVNEAGVVRGLRRSGIHFIDSQAHTKGLTSSNFISRGSGVKVFNYENE